MVADTRRPFSQAYVLEVTLGHVLRCVDTSILKTTARIPEFREDPQKSQEIFQTLERLHELKTLAHDHINRNPQ